jgi:hypothetical protein
VLEDIAPDIEGNLDALKDEDPELEQQTLGGH